MLNITYEHVTMCSYHHISQGIGSKAHVFFLVGGDWNMFYFPIQLGIYNHPISSQLTFTLIIFRGVGSSTKQFLSLICLGIKIPGPSH